MKYLTIKAIFCTISLFVLAQQISIAQPAGPGDGSDPFATPVNGGVAFVATIAFLYGGYKIYKLAKENGSKNTNR